MPRQYIRGPFWSKVNKDGPVPPHMPHLGPCWAWIASTDTGGYGKHQHPVQRRLIRAHRWSWEEFHGAIPDGLWALHHCDNRRCVRPDHLFLGDNAANMRDMRMKGRGISNSPRISGEQHYNARITNDTVRSIRAQFDAGDKPLADIAKAIGLTVAHVRRIVNRTRWKHVQ